MNRNEKLMALQERADLVCSDIYKKISEIQIKKVFDLSLTNIDEKELKGMMRIIAWTNNFVNDYEDFIKKEKEKLNG